MLHGHGRGDHREGFVGHKQTVPPREQIAFEPAFAEMLAQHFHHSAVSAEVIVDVSGLPTKQRFSTSNTLPRRFELVSSGHKRRKFASALFSVNMSRIILPSWRVDS